MENLEEGGSCRAEKYTEGDWCEDRTERESWEDEVKFQNLEVE